MIPVLRDRLRDVAAIERRCLRLEAKCGTEPGPFLLLVEEQVPQRTVLEVITSAARAGYSVPRLEYRTPHGFAAVELASGADFTASSDGRDLLAVRTGPGGYRLTAGGGDVAPGCVSVGGHNQYAVPLRFAERSTTGELDPAGLTRCLATLRRQWPQDIAGIREIDVGVDPDRPFGDLARTILAVREQSPGACQAQDETERTAGCLFPRVRLGVLEDPGAPGTNYTPTVWTHALGDLLTP